MSTTTHIETRRKIAAALKARVCELLGWDEQQYADFQYECGLRYLRHSIPADNWGQDWLQRAAIFWNWWKNEWCRRDAEFCEPEEGWHPELLGTENMRRLYHHEHNPIVLASEIYPNRVVLDESYNQMISELIKETVNA